jgi:aminobenzoyl-glutamate utilization protein A
VPCSIGYLEGDVIMNNTDFQKWLVGLRRDFHKYAEPGWFEFRTASLVAKNLSEMGYKVMTGPDVVETASIMGRREEAISKQIERALSQGADREWTETLRGFPAVVGILETERPGPTISLRFDMDAVEVTECRDEKHRPYREGFSSVNDGAMHACGHDGHTAMGLGLAKLLMERKDSVKGTIKLIFQPAEEGVRGAKAIVEKGILDDSDYFLAMHLGMGIPSGKVIGGASGFLCTTKFDVEFTGRSAHAGAAPNEGHNALLAASNAALNIHAIAPHKDGVSRVNVGVLRAGEGRNVVPSKAFMAVETRGETETIAAYMFDRASSIVESCASMYETKSSITKTGEAITTDSDDCLSGLVQSVVSRMEEFDESQEHSGLGGSDDATWMMKRVQNRGGKATYIMLGADIAAGHHNERFDFDESTLKKGAMLLDQVIKEIESR